MIYPLLYIPFCIWFAYMNAKWIADRRRIKHFWNGFLHLTVAGVVGTFCGWRYGLAVLFVARLVFDTSLNLFRHFGIGYVPTQPKAIMDKIEKKLFFNNGIIPKILYLFIIIYLYIFK